MIRCNKCGTLNEAEASFCTECNSYLEWGSEKIQDDPQGTSLGSDADQDGSVAKELAAEATGATEPASARSTGSASQISDPTAPAPNKAGAPPDSRTPGDGVVPPGATDKSADSAADGIPARVPKPAAPEQPSSRRPAKATARVTATAVPRPREAAAATTVPPRPGDLLCGTCGSGNDPARKFCRRCGHKLAPAPAVVAPGKGTYAAGTRPSDLGGKRRWRPGWITVILGLLLVIGIAGVVVYLSVPAATNLVDDAVTAVTDRVEGRTLAYPSATGDSATGGPASEAVDGNLATYWLGRQNERSRWVLDLRFERAVDLRSVNVHSGADGDGYLQFGRPRQVRIRSGDVSSEIITLEDVDTIQSIAVDFSGIRDLRLIVLDSYRGEPGSSDVAIRELEFEVAK